MKHAPDRKLSALTVDTLDMDSEGTAINIITIINYFGCKPRIEMTPLC